MILTVPPHRDGFGAVIQPTFPSHAHDFFLCAQGGTGTATSDIPSAPTEEGSQIGSQAMTPPPLPRGTRWRPS
jgi:hypothetical protein